MIILFIKLFTYWGTFILSAAGCLFTYLFATAQVSSAVVVPVFIITVGVLACIAAGSNFALWLIGYIPNKTVYTRIQGVLTVLLIIANIYTLSLAVGLWG